MSWIRQTIFCLAAATAAVTASAQTPPPGKVAASSTLDTHIFPPAPTYSSPVSFFRQLLAMTPAERMGSLTNRSPEVRARILAKVREYQALAPDERELRLRATELRWYLVPLMRTPPAQRDPNLEQVPPELRDLVKARLDQWNILPPPLQNEFLTNDKTLHYFSRVEVTSPPNPDPQQQDIVDRFNRFFDLTPAEKQKTLGTLSAAERAQMDKTLQTFEQMPAQQRILCVRNYAKFAGMTAGERAEFLKNAESWSKMSPAERQTWRDLVEHVPLWPPVPASLPPMPPMPQHVVPRASHAGGVATK